MSVQLKYNFTKQTLSSFTQYENHHFSSNFNYLQCCIFCTTASRWIIYDKWRHGNGNDSKYKNIKISGTFSKTARLEFADAKSQNRFTGTAKFKFVFGAVNAYHSMTHYMFAPMYSVNDFGIAQFEVKKDKRYLTTVKIKPFGTSSTGVKESDRVKATTKELEKGVYIMEITAEPGEYCIIFNSMGTGGYSGTFDFGID